MRKIVERLIKIIIFLLSFSFFGFMMYGYLDRIARDITISEITDISKIASLAISSRELKELNEMFLTTFDHKIIKESNQYKIIASKLIGVKNLRPNLINWSYTFLNSAQHTTIITAVSDGRFENNIGFYLDDPNDPKMFSIANQRQQYISNVQYNEIYGYRYITSYHPIYDHQKNFLGMIGLEILQENYELEIQGKIFISLIYGFIVAAFFAFISNFIINKQKRKKNE